MIVYVKVDKTHKPGQPVINSAWRAWVLGGLLSNQQKRNSCKYLVAIFGKEIIASFCIHAIAKDPQTSPRRRVRFGLTETDDNCHKNIVDACSTILAKINSTPKECGYLDVSTNFNCTCKVDVIPVVDESSIQIS